MRTAVLCLLGAVALATSPDIALSADTGQRAIVFTDSCPPPQDGAPYGPLGQLCAMVKVPLDYRNPSGQQITVAVSKISAANPSLRRGVLFLNPGGPGGPGLDMPRIFTFLLGGTKAQSVLDEYDLIGFDPRGVGRSTPVTCGLTPEQLDQALPPLEQNHSFDATTEFVKTVAAGCAKSSGSLLPFINTANTAQDMDAIRQGLGESKLNYFAWSYGTYLGAVYATLYPDNTDRVVIDSNIDPNWVWRTMFRKWGLGGQTRWPDFANWAAANDATYHFGSTPEEVTALFFQLLAKADAQPFQDPNFFLDSTLINGAMFRALTFDFLEHDASFIDTAILWQDTQSAGGSAGAVRASGTLPPAGTTDGNDPVTASENPTPKSSPVFPRDIQVPADNVVASGLAVLCDDVQWSRTPEQYQAELEQDSMRYPMFGPMGSNIWECAFWPNAPIRSPVKITANGPANILMLQNLRDPNTPYPGGVEMHTALGRRSRLVTVDGGGHAIYGLEPDSTCATEIVTEYLAKGAFPDQDVSCPGPSATAAAPAAAAESDAKQRLRKFVLRQLVRPTHLRK